MTGGTESQAALWQPTFGAVPGGRDTAFRVWAPTAGSITVVVEDAEGRPLREARLHPDAEGMFSGLVEAALHGTRYRYRLDGRPPMPDPASRYQPAGVHGPSEVVDWTRFRWTDDDWHGVRFDDLVIYELHVGTFTANGTFAGVVDRLPYLADLGVTAIELMPIAAFAGARNWGYDGVALFAPAHQYGGPSGLQQLVDAAHRAGLAVLVDVMYNHLGPDGAYLSAFSPGFFSPVHQSPWGDGVNLDSTGSGHVRRFLIENALHWINEYHVDGLRLDAIHALVDDGDRHFLAELSDTVRLAELGREVHLIAEDERNMAKVVRPTVAGGYGIDGVWADDFHHEVHRLLTGESDGYYGDFAGSADALATTINQGWFYTGQVRRTTGKARGSDPSGVHRKRFIVCVQNHDQVGNRAMGERISHLTDLGGCRAAAAVLLLVPETPLLFMGEEWAASTPFLYFTDHHEELGRLVTKGRRREFARFAAFSDPAARARIPDPQAYSTFLASRLQWDEVDRRPHASMLSLYRELIGLRRAQLRRPASDLEDEQKSPVAHALDPHTVAILRHATDGALLVVAHFGHGGRVQVPPPVALNFVRGHVVLTTEDERFAPGGVPPRVNQSEGVMTIDFARPSALVLSAHQAERGSTRRG